MTEPHDNRGPTPPHQRWPGNCSFCRKSYRDVGPLAEGPDDVLICYGCVEKCARIIETQSRRAADPLRLAGQKCDVQGCKSRVTAHFFRAEGRRLVAEGHLCDEHGRPFLRDYDFWAATPSGRAPFAHEAGVSFDPELIFFHDAHDQRGPACQVYLLEAGGTRRTGITVGPFEGQALQRELRGDQRPRPAMHRAMAAVINALGGALQYAVIDKSVPPQEPGYVGKLRIQQTSTPVDVEVRPSDAVILAVIYDVPIIISNDVLARLAKTQR